MDRVARGLLTAGIVLVSTCGQTAVADDVLSSDAKSDSAEHNRRKNVEPITDILVVLDATASMEYRTGSVHGSSRLDLARTVTANVLDAAPTGINVGVLTLRDDVSELRPLEPLAAADRTQIRRGVETLNPFGEGDLVTCFSADYRPTRSGLVPVGRDGHRRDGFQFGSSESGRRKIARHIRRATEICTGRNLQTGSRC
jgi:hypothetical protein